jgi:hypothetical protein
VKQVTRDRKKSKCLSADRPRRSVSACWSAHPLKLFKSSQDGGRTGAKLKAQLRQTENSLSCDDRSLFAIEARANESSSNFAEGLKPWVVQRWIVARVGLAQRPQHDLINRFCTARCGTPDVAAQHVEALVARLVGNAQHRSTAFGG